jgi:hydroxyacylglutathione hydrolase
MNELNLLALPAFVDNYIWMLHDGSHAVVVDPGDASPVHQALDELGLQLAGILVTHHHADHVGGIASLRSRLQGPVWGPATENIPGPFVALHDGDTVEALGRRWQVLEVPGHTAGHIAYLHSGASEAPLLFCGDTLFSAGCGRLFEGTPAQMHASLARLAALPPDTRVCCTHEYTLSNLRFAAAVEPGNAARAAYQVQCQTLRDAGRPTLPSSVRLELQINPFLRCTQPEVVASARAHGAAANDAVSVFAALREWKNTYR